MSFLEQQAQEYADAQELIDSYIEECVQNAFIAGYHAAHKWIPIEECTEDGMYLCISPVYGREVLRRYNGKWTTFTVNTILENGAVVGGGYDAYPTHFMYIPELPQQ